MTYRAALAWLFSLQKLGVKLGLDHIRALLADLGHPERAWPSLLVTGTNGKGLVAAMATAALRARGLKVGTYTSPHLVRLTERIVIDGEPIAPVRLARAAAALRRRIAVLLERRTLAHHPTFFEVVTAIAFAEFARARVDFAVLEVGLGGRFDATNAADPLVSVVTTVALEHTRWLGDTVAAIAFEKSGIARPGRPLVTGLGPGPARDVLRARAGKDGCPLVLATRAVRLRRLSATRRGLALVVETRRGRYPPIRLPLPGRHQALNARVAIAALEALPETYRPTPAEVARGLARTRWPGRIEYVPGAPALLLDGAHNPHAARALAAFLAAEERRRPRVLVFACLGDKDVAFVLRPLVRGFDAVVLTTLGNPRALTAKELRPLLPRRLAAGAQEAPDVATALALARARTGRRGLVVITGSLYLVGEAKALLAGEPPPDQG